MLINRIIAYLLIILFSVSPMLAVDHQETFIGTGDTHDFAEQDARSQASPQGGISAVLSIETKQKAPKMWICVLKTKISN